MSQFDCSRRKTKKHNHLTDKAEYIREARAKYEAYDADVWIKAYFDEDSGGYCVYHKKHNFSKVGGGGEVEKILGILLAKYHGKQVEFLPEGWQKQPDITFDGKTWDIKFIDQANEETIRKAIRDACKADNAIFYFTKDEKYLTLLSAIEREVGRYTKGQIKYLPDIYFINESRLLSVLWKK